MKKGQYFTLEQMMLFSIGVLLTVGIYYSLAETNKIIKTSFKEDQMNEISNLIESEISNAYLHGGYYKKTVKIPENILDEGYKIYIQKDVTFDNLTLEMGEESIVRKIRKEYNASGVLFSSNGKIIIEKIKGIQIGRF